MFRSPITIVNSALSVCFSSGRDIRVDELQVVMYLTAIEFRRLTGENLFEAICVDKRGVNIPPIRFKFDCFGSKPIRRYAPLADGTKESYTPEGFPTLYAALGTALAITAAVPLREIYSVVWAEGTALQAGLVSGRVDLDSLATEARLILALLQ